MSAKRRVAEITGAGLAGLAAATALAQRGWEVRVHEKAKELREIGAGLYLYENALNVRWGVYEQIAASGVEMTVPRALRDHNNQPVKVGRDTDRLPELIVMLRTELHKILADQALACGVEVVTNSRVLGATNDGCLEFSTGFGARADLIIGADGVFSRVRDSLRLTKGIVELKRWLWPSSHTTQRGGCG